MEYEQVSILLGRGCPFNCTFCSNHSLKRLSEGEYVHIRSPQSIAKEIKQIKSRHTDISRIHFEVETIGANLNQLFDLCSELNKLNNYLSQPVSFSTNFRVAPGLDVEYSRTKASLDFKEFSRRKITFAWIFFEAKVFWNVWPLRNLIKLTFNKIIITYPIVGSVTAKIYGVFCICRNTRNLLRDCLKV